MAKQSRKNPKKQQRKRETTSPKFSIPAGQPAFLTDSKMHVLIIALLGFLLYANTLTHDFTLDDAIVITDNMFTKKGVAGIPDILSKDTFFGFFKDQKNLVAGGRYRPFTLVMFAFEYQLFGQTPFIYHLINILLYCLTGIVLYFLLLKLLNPQKNPANLYAYFVAFVAALLYVAHPIHTEAVANIKGRDEIMTLLCSLGALYYSLRAYYEKANKWTIVAAVLFFIGLMSKENAITFLAVVPLAFYVFTNAKMGDIIKQTIPFVGVAILFLIIRTAVIGLGGSVGTEVKELMNNPYLKIVDGKYVAYSVSERLGTIFYTLGKYIQLLVFPHPLTNDYYPRQIAMYSLGSWQVVLIVLGYLAAAGYAIWGLLKKQHIAFGIAFYIITLSIVSNIVFPIGTNMSERFMFMPSVGFCFIVAILLYKLAQLISKKENLNFNDIKIPLGILGVVLLLFAGKTITRNFVWQDNKTLFLTDVHASTNSAKALNAAGGESVTQAIKPENSANKEKMLRDGIGYLDKAIKIHPTYKNAYLLLGNAHTYLEEYDKAIPRFEQALRIDPKYKDALLNMGVACRGAEKYDDAIKYHKKAYELHGTKFPVTKKTLLETYRFAGEFFGKKGQLDKSINLLLEALKLAPNDAPTMRTLGTAYGIRQETQKAIDIFEKSLKIEPNHAPTFKNLSIAYGVLGNQAKAAEYAQKANQ